MQVIVERDGHKKAVKILLPTPAAKAAILKEHETQRREVEQLALEKRRGWYAILLLWCLPSMSLFLTALQDQQRVATGQTNEEILQNRKKKRPVSAVIKTPSSPQTQSGSQLQPSQNQPQNAPTDKSKNSSPSASPSIAKDKEKEKEKEKEKKKKKSGFGLIPGFKTTKSESSSPSSTPPPSPGPSSASSSAVSGSNSSPSVPTLQVAPLTPSSSTPKSPATRKAVPAASEDGKLSPPSERKRSATTGTKPAEAPNIVITSTPNSSPNVPHAESVPPPRDPNAKELSYEAIKQSRAELDLMKLEVRIFACLHYHCS